MRQCPHCGNEIVFDQTKGADATCPVCHAPVITMAQQQMETFSCHQCGIRLTVSKGATTFVCPVCDCVKDGQALDLSGPDRCTIETQQLPLLEKL